MRVNDIARHALSVIFPSGCVSCGNERTVYPFPVCPGCVTEILSSDPPERMCSGRIKKTHSCLWYTPSVKCCIQSFKFRGNIALAGFFKRILRSYTLCSGIRKENHDIIVPVPLHRLRKRKRGYNQSEILAKMAADMLGIPVRADILTKVRNTPPQSGLTKTERNRNLKGSFAVADMSALKGKSVLLVDDVTTTGTTLEECARVLTASGASSISAFTLARVI
jgi:competence protein ComFC